MFCQKIWQPLKLQFSIRSFNQRKRYFVTPMYLGNDKRVLLLRVKCWKLPLFFLIGKNVSSVNDFVRMACRYSSE